MGRVSQLANVGDYLTLEVFDGSIVVIRGENRDLTGFYNVCARRAHRLLEGNVKRNTCRIPGGGSPGHVFDVVTTPDTKQQRAYEVLQQINV